MAIMSSFLILKGDRFGRLAAGQWRATSKIDLNEVTIRDSGMRPSVDELSEDVFGYPITSASDYCPGYYQIALDVSSRDLTSFIMAFRVK